MIREAILKVLAREDLSEPEMMSVMDEISEGQATPAQIGALLMGLRMKGESVEEISGSARVLKAKSSHVPVRNPEKIMVDTCGTGGDGSGTFNVSTTAALVLAGCGIKVAKHGNRAFSSRCGSADVLETLGVKLDLTPEEAGECLDRVGIGFLFAPLLHPAMRHAVHPRREVGFKTIFNLVGPLTNPAGAQVQVMGVYAAELTETMARVLLRLGCRSAFVVYGEDGYDEISITGSSRITRLFEGRITTSTLVPEEVGLKRARREDILGGDADLNASITLGVLEGRTGPCRDMVLLNAAAALVASGQARDFRIGLDLAAEAIDSGRAREKLKELVAVSRELTGRKKAVGE